jgi:uncharacterized membrane protein YqjE
MADQATMNRNGGNGNGGGTDVIGRVAGLGEDLSSLAELQAKLAFLEWDENFRKARGATVAIVAGAVFALSTFPVLLIGLAELLTSEWPMKRGYAYLVVVAAALLLAGIGIAAAIVALRARQIGFPRTREELTRNWRWVRTVLAHSGRPVEHHRRF